MKTFRTRTYEIHSRKLKSGQKVRSPLRNYLPGYMNSEIRAQVVENALRVDSLQQLVDRQNLYI